MPVLPPLGDAVPQRGNAFSRWFGRTLLRLLGWRVVGEVPNIPKCVVIGAPHTSNWDFVVAMGAKLGMGIDVRFLGKDTLFRPPLGWLMRRLGGTPVDRSVPRGAVAQAVAQFEQHERFYLGLSPEGTRKRVEQWRTGFYHIAHAAGVPILPFYFDFPSRTFGLGPLVHPTGDLGADVARLRAFYAPFTGKNPELG
ncbi:MAG: lysophospholipid acyltransferase family protein [Rhodothermales bacterium]|nr:lysophospholipid acyltransferase family protein [Rhodothermales bacterium]